MFSPPSHIHLFHHEFTPSNTPPFFLFYWFSFPEIRRSISSLNGLPPTNSTRLLLFLETHGAQLSPIYLWAWFFCVLPFIPWNQRVHPHPYICGHSFFLPQKHTPPFLLIPIILFPKIHTVPSLPCNYLATFLTQTHHHFSTFAYFILKSTVLASLAHKSHLSSFFFHSNTRHRFFQYLAFYPWDPQRSLLSSLPWDSTCFSFTSSNALHHSLI